MQKIFLKFKNSPYLENAKNNIHVLDKDATELSNNGGKAFFFNQKKKRTPLYCGMPVGHVV